MKKRIAIEASAIDSMKRHALETFPEECCGFMFGSDNSERLITQTKEANNIKKENRERRFEVDPLDYLNAEKYADASGLDLIGIYHSHPNHPAIPSEHDREQAVGYFSYVIVSVNKDEVVDIKSWQLDDSEKFIEEEIETKPVLN